MKEMIEGVKEKAEMKDISRDQWDLEATDMTTKAMIVIAKARWIHHKERCQIDMGKRKRMNTQIQMNRLDRALKIVEEREERKRKEKEDKKREREEKTKDR